MTFKPDRIKFLFKLLISIFSHFCEIIFDIASTFRSPQLRIIFSFCLFVQCLYIDFEAYCFVITSRGAKPGLLEPFADLFWLSALHVRIYHMKKELATENKNKNKNIPGTIRMIILSPVPTMPVPDQAPAIK